MSPAPIITGAGVVSALGVGLPAFTEGLQAGVSAVRPWDGAPHPRPLHAALLPGGVPDGPPVGTPEEVGERAALRTRRAPLPLRATVCAALQAAVQAGLWEEPIDGDRLGVVVGAAGVHGADVAAVLQSYGDRPHRTPPRTALTLPDTYHVSVVSEVLGARGEGTVVGAASASGAAALVQSARLVTTGEVDVCMAVGALQELGPGEIGAFAGLGAMAEAGADGVVPPPLHRDHRGFAYGQGAAAVVVESPQSAARRGARPLAEVAGAVQRLDANALADPDEDGEVATMTAALARAGVPPEAVGYVNAHATGAPLGDRTEVRAIERVWGRCAEPPAVNATKLLTGHCLSGAGLVEAVATIAQLRGGFLHRTVGPAEALDTGAHLVGPHYVPTAADIALSASYGFGGFSIAVVLRKPR